MLNKQKLLWEVVLGHILKQQIVLENLKDHVSKVKNRKISQRQIMKDSKEKT